MPSDEKGYIGRECPNSECEGYFKVLPGTGIQGANECYCPYCGYKGQQNEFFTKDQIEYIRSYGKRFVADALTPGRAIPIHNYREKDLETYIECSNCTLKYAVYGVFGFCPDCGQHNSMQILQKNLKVVQKMLDVAKLIEHDTAERIIQNALESCISSFDGFGRELVKIHRTKSKFPDKINKISFQSLDGAKESIRIHYEFNLDQGISGEEWKIAKISFQKRHLLAHKMGIIDEEYLRRSDDNKAIIGRKVVIISDEVLNLIPILEKLAGFMIDSMNKVGKT